MFHSLFPWVVQLLDRRVPSLGFMSGRRLVFVRKKTQAHRCARITTVMSTSRSILAFAWSLVAALGAIGQNSPAGEKPTIEKVRDLHLPYAAGAVPVYYSVGAEARALKYQKAIIACQQWYDQQVGKHVDVTLAVLSKADWDKVTDIPYPMPANVGGWRSLPPPGVVIPARFEDYPNSADFADDPELLVENIAFHELGHLYAHYLDMEIDDTFWHNSTPTSLWSRIYARSGLI